jgi:eukaryotic-like serine/threonine-protein kinase
VPAAPNTTEELLAIIRDSRVLPDATAESTLAAAKSLPADPVHAATALVRRGVLTQFQARMLLSGKFRGFRLGDYLIQDQIGQGGMGAVYLANHQSLERRVAIKVLPAASATDRIALERFLREARTVAALDHPNVVKLFDVCKQNEVRYLVMEYVEGQTLEKLMQSGGIAPGRAVGYIAQAAAGLQHAHEKGFIHRDIKPANLMLTAGDTVKILDMGLARSVSKDDNLTEAFDRGAVVGTADYVAPEQAMNLPKIDIRADIYSLGGTFFALVTGRPPFAGNTASKLVQHQLKDAPSITQLDRTFPPKLAAVVSKMMAKKPDDRYRTPADVIVALQPWLTESASLTAAVAGTLEGNDRLSSRNLIPNEPQNGSSRIPPWVWVAGGSAALAVLAGGVIAGIWLSQDTKPVSRLNPQNSAPAPAPTPAPELAPVVSVPISKSAPEPTIIKPPVAPKTWVNGKVLYTLNLSQQKPFQTEGSTAGMSNKTGAGDFPDGWSVKTWVAEHKGIGFADDSKGGPALGIRPVSGNTILFSPEVSLSGKYVKVQFEYQTTSASTKNTIRAREMTQTKTENDNLAAAADWTKFEKVYDVSAFKNALRIEFHNSDVGSEFRLRNFQLLLVEPK